MQMAREQQVEIATPVSFYSPRENRCTLCIQKVSQPERIKRPPVDAFASAFMFTQKRPHCLIGVVISGPNRLRPFSRHKWTAPAHEHAQTTS